jgi:hypothetical protein
MLTCSPGSLRALHAVVGVATVSSHVSSPLYRRSMNGFAIREKPS